MRYLYLLVVVLTAIPSFSQTNARFDILLNNKWKTVANDSDKFANEGFEASGYDDKLWKTVDIPHNWDSYDGYRRIKHGNRHGFAWYRKSFEIPVKYKGKQIFLWFEGVGSYATVWVNGKDAGSHAGGRTSFHLDITDLVSFDKPNILAVRADHPANIKDLPWVCGGCSREYGFSEGSQPMGIFRPVHLEITSPVRIEPFGVHIWNDTTVTEKSAALNIETEIKNYSSQSRSIAIINQLLDKYGKTRAEVRSTKVIPSGSTLNISQDPMIINDPHLWSLDDPYLYTLETKIVEKGRVIDEVNTPYGIRWISWPVGKKSPTNRFLLNGKPVLINGTAEYEHNMGQSHAFSEEQIHTRVMQVKAAGYNAFRDAHQPHNLRYQEYWDKLGFLWWPQMSAHIWYDTPEFRTNFKKLLTDWIKERRNSPSVILWGLQNESTLPAAFAEECSDLIRKLDPTTSSQRKITTCNGGTGTDWNVIQNWSGTYGSNSPLAYGEEMKSQLLNGEYGAWRSIDLHTAGPFVQNSTLSEDRMTLLMESKIRLADSVKDEICGQFHWLLNSHENPGRIQNGEGFRDIDRVGPVNYKGLFTPWGEPTDAFYMFRSNFTSKEKEPMVYIVSHTWPGRWTSPGIKDSIIVYSNCDSVRLYNDMNSLGTRIRKGIGTHFQWDNVNVHYNSLFAYGFAGGKRVATDIILLNHLRQSPHINLPDKKNDPVNPGKGYHYLYRVNCGGPEYTDKNGNTWFADQRKTDDNSWGSRSWTDVFPGLPAFYGSQRRTFDPLPGTADWKLFQSFRYGRDKLSYEFTVPDGEYLVEMFFIEPWYGIGGGMNCKGWRLFDVALNDRVVIDNLDIWVEAGTNRVLKKSATVKVSGGKLIVSFPEVASGQAVISAIAVSSRQNVDIKQSGESGVISDMTSPDLKVRSWLDLGDRVYSDDSTTFRSLPPALFGSTWIKGPKTISKPGSFRVAAISDVFIALDSRITDKPYWMNEFSDAAAIIETDTKEGNVYKVFSKRLEAGSDFEMGPNGSIDSGKANMYLVSVVPVANIPQTGDLRPEKRYEAENAESHLKADTIFQKTGIRMVSNDSVVWNISVGIADIYSLKFRYMNTGDKPVKSKIRIVSSANTVVYEGDLEFPMSPDKWRTLNTTTGNSINAGNYRIILIPEDRLALDFLEVQ